MSVTAQALNEAFTQAINNPKDPKFVESFRKLLNAAEDPNFYDADGYPGIVLATMKRRLDLVNVFLNNSKIHAGAEIKSGENALYFAAALKNLPNETPAIDFIQLLASRISLFHENSVKKTVIADTKEKMERFCSHKNAVLQKSGEYLKTVVLPALEALAVQEQLNQELYQAVVVEQSIAKVKPLVERGANINWVNFETGRTCLEDLISTHRATDIAIYIVDAADELKLDFSTVGCQHPQAKQMIASVLECYRLCDYVLASHERDCRDFETSGMLAQEDLDAIVRETKVPNGQEHYLLEKNYVKSLLEAYVMVSNNIRAKGKNLINAKDLEETILEIKRKLTSLKQTKENYLKAVAEDHVRQTAKAVVKNGGYLGAAYSDQSVNRYLFHANPQNAMAANMKRPAGPAPVPPQRAAKDQAARSLTTRVK